MVNNKGLALLTVILIIFSFFIIVYDNFYPITGRGVSDSGNVSIELSSETAIRVYYHINFGNGRVNATADSAILDSATGSVKNGTWSFSSQFLRVENDGTVNISVNVTSDKNVGSFIGGTNPTFKIKGVATEAGACGDLNTTYFDISNTNKTICPLLTFGTSVNEFNVSARLEIPSDASSTVKTSTLTFTAIAT